MDKPAQDRKRKASNALRVFAEELQVANRSRNYDLTKPQFASLLVRVEGHCSTPDQRQRAQEANALVFATAALPPIPPLPILACGKHASSAASSSSVCLPQPGSEADTGRKEFRLRGTSCLFTYNSSTWSNVEPDSVWNRFMLFLASLNFVSCWTATLETSL